MSINHRSSAQPGPQRKAQSTSLRRKVDQRARRTRERLGNAFLSLILEKDFESVTIQDVLDRASVGRSTFYLHFRDKNDLLLCQFERFLGTMSTMLSERNEISSRVAPVTEMFAHLHDVQPLLRTLAAAGRLNDFFDLAQDYFTRSIEQRLKASKRLPAMSAPELTARSAAITGSLLSLLRWWLDHGAREPASEMDTLFHRTVWNGLR